MYGYLYTCTTHTFFFQWIKTLGLLIQLWKTSIHHIIQLFKNALGKTTKIVPEKEFGKYSKVGVLCVYHLP